MMGETLSALRAQIPRHNQHTLTLAVPNKMAEIALEASVLRLLMKNCFYRAISVTVTLLKRRLNGDGLSESVDWTFNTSASFSLDI